MKYVVLVSAALAVVLILIFFSTRASRQPEVATGGLTISTQAESDSRSSADLPVEGSEDKGFLLRPPSLPAGSPEKEGDYLPDSEVDWSISAQLANNEVIEQAAALELFDRDWVEANGYPEIFGKSVDGRWTFLRARGAPELYTALAFGWGLAGSHGPSGEPLSAKTLELYHASVRERLVSLGEATTTASTTPDLASKKAEDLAEVLRDCDRQAIVVLRAPANEQFDGRQIWDTMLSLGLRWGDMDLFHWINSSSVGDDVFFSVWTTTEPGYFLPEEIAAGRVIPRDLVFGFSIPRSPAPLQVFESMMEAARYAQSRLGGVLVGSDGNRLDPEGLAAEISVIEQTLREAGLPPGEVRTLFVF